MVSHARATRLFDRLWVPCSILAMATLFVIGASTYKGDAATFPTAVGILTALLALAEVILRASSRTGATADADGETALRARLLGGWFVATLACLFVLGVLPAIAISASVYFYAFVWRRVVWALGAGLAHAAFFWIAFELLAGFRLYPGILD